MNSSNKHRNNESELRIISGDTEFNIMETVAKSEETQIPCIGHDSNKEYDMTIECESKININDFPVKVLKKILEYLPTSERKNLKLVCKRWKKICNKVSFSIKEKLIIHGGYKYSDVNKVFTSKRKGLNIKFDCVKLKEYPDTFWQQHGHKIYSIEIRKCEINTTTLVNIFISCSNLGYLSYDSRNEYRKESVNIIKDLATNYVVSNKLEHLEIVYTNRNLLTNNSFEEVLKVFPRIKSLNVKYLIINFNDYAIQEDAVKNFKIIRKRIMSSLPEIGHVRIEFATTFQTYTGIEWNAVTFANNFTWLKEIDICIKFDYISVGLILWFFMRLPRLEGIRCSIEYKRKPRTHFINEFILHLLNVCANLRHLSLLTGGNEKYLTGRVLTKIAESNLESFSLEFLNMKKVITIKTNTEIPLQRNHTLRSLDIRGDFSDDLVSRIIAMFCNLKNITLDRVGGEALQTVWKYHPNLQRLTLLDCIADSYGFSVTRGEDENIVNTSYAISRLQKLENLRFIIHEKDSYYYSEWFDEIGLLKLRHFQVDIRHSPETSNALMKAIGKLKTLESLWLECSDTHFEKWEEVLSKLENLKYLRLACDWDEKFTFMHCLRFFQLCPSLRIFDHRGNVYYLHTLENRVKKVKEGNDIQLPFGEDDL